MRQKIERLLDDYQAWLKDRTVVRQVGEWVEITTPYLDRHNDYLQIYATKENGHYVLSDGGYVIADLELSGCALNTEKRLQLLQMTLNGFGVRREGDILQVRASDDDFPLKKHNFVQAMLAVNDMFYMAEPRVASLFYEDVVNWLDACDIRYTTNVKFTGTSGYDHHYDFVIPKSARMPERLLTTITTPGRDSAQRVAFGWFDTKRVRPADANAYALLNDTEKTVSGAVTEALLAYGVVPVPWSERERVKDELAA